MHKIVMEVVQPIFDHTECRALPLLMKSLNASMTTGRKHRERWDRQLCLIRKTDPYQAVLLFDLVSLRVASVGDGLIRLLRQLTAVAIRVKSPTVIWTVKMSIKTNMTT